MEENLFEPRIAIGSEITEKDYERISYLKKTLETISRSTYQFLYVIDYLKAELYFVSENMPYLMEYTVEEIYSKGSSILAEIFCPEEMPLLIEMTNAGFNYSKNIAPEEKTKYVVSCDYHLRNKTGKNLYAHKMQPLMVAPDGNIWLMLGFISLSSNRGAGNFQISKSGSNEYAQYNFDNHCWETKLQITPDKYMIDILQLSAHGLSIEEIADKMSLSVPSIKYHKKRIFSEFKVTNITEAVVKAINYGLI